MDFINAFYFNSAPIQFRNPIMRKGFIVRDPYTVNDFLNYKQYNLHQLYIPNYIWMKSDTQVLTSCCSYTFFVEDKCNNFHADNHEKGMHILSSTTQRMHFKFKKHYMVSV